MSIGNSGRIVIEVEPETKKELYAALSRDGSTLKQWFLKSVDVYLSNANAQLLLSLQEKSGVAFLPDRSMTDPVNEQRTSNKKSGLIKR